MQKSTKSFVTSILFTIFSICTAVCSVVWAAFQASKTNTSTITFANAITLTVTGITKSGSAYYWDYKRSTYETSYTAGKASIVGVVDYFELAPITVKVTAGAPCYVRVFACFGTDLPTSTITIANFPSITAQSGTTAASVVSSSNYIDKESGFTWTSTSNQTKKFVSLCNPTNTTTTYTVVSPYIPYNAKGTTEYANANVLNKKFYIYLSISASTDNTTANWQTFTITATT